MASKRSARVQQQQQQTAEEHRSSDFEEEADKCQACNDVNQRTVTQKEFDGLSQVQSRSKACRQLDLIFALLKGHAGDLRCDRNLQAVRKAAGCLVRTFSLY